MQRNQWRKASEQLLKHWQRSGISQIPSSSVVAESAASDWLDANASTVFAASTQVFETAPQESAVSSTAALVREPAPVAVFQPPTVNTAEELPPGSINEFAIAKWNTKALPMLERSNSLGELNDAVIACRKCEEIVCRRQRTVFGVGSLNTRVVMFGEAPGADEDRLGEPFVGAAGQLLDKILAACGLGRSEVYILNALKCRPPNNRTPTENEIENCRPFFEQQLETIQPEYIVCWGAVAVRAVLQSTASVGRLRGRFHAFRGAKVLVTYHPAYLLRNTDAKRLTWEDMKLLMKDMGRQIPGKNV